ncbi:hypothetical protein [Mycobacterium phage WXIN]|nr:hypothetical protein [Mycobacterium phage WXIN]
MKINRHAIAAIAVPAVPVIMALGIGAAYANPLARANDYTVRCADVERCWTVEVDGSSVDVPECQYEDGNVNGMPCIWTDSDTGRQFYVASENYR